MIIDNATQETAEKSKPLYSALFRLPTKPISLKDSKINSRVYDVELECHIYAQKEFNPKKDSELLDTLLISDFIEKNNLEKAIQECLNLVESYFSPFEPDFFIKLELQDDRESLFLFIFSDLVISESSKIILDILKNMTPQCKYLVKKFINIVDRKK